MLMLSFPGPNSLIEMVIWNRGHIAGEWVNKQTNKTLIRANSSVSVLFLFLHSSGQTIDLDLEMEGDDKIVGLGSVVQTSTIQGQITQIETDGTTDGKFDQLQLFCQNWNYEFTDLKNNNQK